MFGSHLFNRRWSAWMAGLAVGYFPTLAQADTPNSTLGSVIHTASNLMINSLMVGVVTLSYLAGLWLIKEGLVRFIVQAKTSGQQAVFSDGVLRIIAGAALLALPDMMGIGVQSLLQSSYYSSNVSGAPVGGVSDCLSGTSSDSIPLTCMAKNLSQNAVPVAVEAVFGFSVIWGAVMIFTGFYTMGNEHNGSQMTRSSPGESKAKWKIVFGFIMCNVPILMYDLGNTLGISTSTITGSGFANSSTSSSILSYTPTTSNAALTQYAGLIGYLFVIMVFFGVVSFVRGWLILKSVADGDSRKTAGNAYTHIIAGVALANSKISICWIVGTLLGNGLGFCS